jgi:hypothetical protein
MLGLKDQTTNINPEMQWFHDYFNDVDTMQIEKMAARRAADVIIQFGNEPIMHCKRAALFAIANLWQGFKSIRHAHGQVVSHRHYTSGEGTATFTLQDDRTLSIPGMTILERSDCLVTRLSGHLDFVPLYAPAEAPFVLVDPEFFVVIVGEATAIASPPVSPF